MLALDAWLLWLCSQTGLRLVIGAVRGAGGGRPVDLLALAVGSEDHCPLRSLHRSAQRTTSPRTVPLASQLWRVARRAALVVALNLLLLETLLQLSGAWRESTEELWTMALYSACLAAMVWAAWPLRRHPWTVLLRAGAAFALFAAVSVAAGFYSWHLRPNLGLYREPDWVAQHPGFQRELRQRIEKNLWRKARGGTRREATSFGPVIERVLYSVATQRPIKAEDLDSGREIEVPAEMEKAGEDQFFHWLAAAGGGPAGVSRTSNRGSCGHRRSWCRVPAAMWERASWRANCGVR